ncbi:ferredoxin [Escherichia coli]|uniref:2Fe-2S ferredoxin n=1 Tax=Escherichia coli TaxID=562 RepID=A0A2X1Q812_ECOLX|nr:ferredoxin [Escherichia coli]
MPKIVILPHQDLCPDGAVLEANSGETILDAALRNGIEIEHACEKSCACTTCHCIVREGFDSLPESSEQEDDMLDKSLGTGAGKPFKLPGARYRRRFSSRNPALHYQPCA